MPKNIRIQRKIAFPIFLCLTFLLCIFAIVNIQTIRKITRQKIETEALRLASLKAQEIESFFKERAMIPQIVFKDPFLIRWFSQYRNFRAPVKSDPNYQRIISFFLSMVESDSTIKSVYFATDNTQEYFDQEGRFEEDGYFVKNRSWWNRALEMGKLYCELDDYDYEDSTLSASLQMPVYLHNGRLLGVGGVDILISTVGNIINQIQYKNQGFAFLVDEEGEVVYFPGLELEIGLGKKLTLLDSIYRDTYGFQSLETDIVNRREGMRDIHLKGEDYRVIFTSVHANEPLLDWNLGILVPVSIITSPVHRITNISIFMILFVILAIFALTWTITSSTVKPLNALASRLNEMANQKSNLTYQLPVETKDAIGLTAKNFNQFISQIRNLLIHVIKNTGNVVAWIEKMQQHTSEISNESGEMSIQSKEAADTSKIMLNNVKIMFKGLSQVSELLKKTNQEKST